MRAVTGSAGTMDSCGCGVRRRREHSQERLAKDVAVFTMLSSCTVRASVSRGDGREPRSRAELGVNRLSLNHRYRPGPANPQRGVTSPSSPKSTRSPDLKSRHTCRPVAAARYGPDGHRNRPLPRIQDLVATRHPLTPEPLASAQPAVPAGK